MTDRQDNSATMQGIRILQSWNCVLEDCKVAKIIDIAMLRCWEESRKAATTRRRKAAPSVRTESPRQGAKALLIERSLSKVLLCYFRESNKALRLSAQ